MENGWREDRFVSTDEIKNTISALGHWCKFKTITAQDRRRCIHWQAHPAAGLYQLTQQPLLCDL